MAREITAGVLLKLKDQFSSQIKGAGISVQGFADKAVGMAEKVNGAFSGVAGTLATLGVSVGAGMLLKAGIDYEDIMIRIGTNAGMTAAETNRLRRELLETATAEKIQIKELESFASTLANNAVGFDVISESAGFAAQAIQGLGITGAETAELLSVLVNRGADVDTFKEKLNNLAEIDNRLQGMGLTEFTRYIPQLMELSGAGVDGIEGLYLSILTLNNGATNKKAIAQYTSAMKDFASSRDKIRGFLGFDTKTENGELKDFAEIMEALAAKANEIGDYDIFGKALGLGDDTIMAMKQFNNHYQNTIDKVGKLGDTSNAVSRRAEENARSLKSALTGLQNAVLAQSDELLTKPIEKLAKLLNENPDGLKKAITGVGIALGVLAGMKAFTTVASFIGSLKGIKGGGLNVSGLTNAGGGAGIPVHVTNWGGAALSSPPSLGGGTPTLFDQFGNPITGTALPTHNVPQPSLGSSGMGLKEIAGVMAITTLLAEKVFLPIAQAAHSKLEEKGIDPAVPGISNYYNLNPKVRKKLWAEYQAGQGNTNFDFDGSETALPPEAQGSPGIAPEKTYRNSYKNRFTRRPGQVNKIVTSQDTITAGAVYDETAAFPPEAQGSPSVQRTGSVRRHNRPRTRQANDLDETPAQFSETVYTTSAVSPGIAPEKTYSKNSDSVRRHNRGPHRQVNDLIITPQGQFSTHPDDYIFAMKNPASLVNNVNNKIRNEVSTVERVPQAIPPVIVEGEIELKSELVIDDKGYKLRQRIGKNTTPYKFAVGSAANARLIQ